MRSKNQEKEKIVLAHVEIGLLSNLKDGGRRLHDG